MTSSKPNSGDLAQAIKQMRTPLRRMPFGSVIEALSGFKIVPFDPLDAQDQAVLSRLKQVCEVTAETVNQKGILRPRPNEVGNDIESFVALALDRVGYIARTPPTRGGILKSMGYPDREFTDEFGRVHYLECKTFNIANVATTQRSFYLSPSEEFKVTRDAHHFLVSFEVFVSGTSNRMSIFKTNGWKIVSLENLMVDVKYEFNSDNLRLYARDMILAEGHPR